MNEDIENYYDISELAPFVPYIAVLFFYSRNQALFFYYIVHQIVFRT